MIERDTELQITSEPAIDYSTCYTLADCTDKTTNEAQKIKNAKRGAFLISVRSIPRSLLRFRLACAEGFRYLVAVLRGCSLGI